VLLDRDGVINEDVGSPGVLSVDTFTLIPGAAAAIARLKLAGASVCVVTNQTCVGKGLISEVELSDIHSRMRDLLLEQETLNPKP
jgi:D-glycero-D-manno-heptose 1,7-bisphosphate phosphatase